MKYHLAQANIARFKASLDDPTMKEFVDFLEPVNRFAEESPGFIWRLKDDQGRAASYLESPFKDEMMAVNISVWADLDALKDFVYGTVHSYFLRNKKNGSTSKDLPFSCYGGCPRGSCRHCKWPKTNWKPLKRTVLHRKPSVSASCSTRPVIPQPYEKHAFRRL